MLYALCAMPSNMLAYETHGQGKPVVLLHAFPLSRKMWEPQIAPLSKKYRLILPDLPGFGESKRLAKPSILDAARELEALLISLKIEEPVVLGGLSMGGYAALELLRQFPERKVSAFALMSSRATADSAEMKEKRAQGIETIRQHGLKPYARKLVTTLTGKTTQEKNPALVEKVLNLMLSSPAEAVTDALSALAERRDNTAALQSYKGPLMILTGEEDGAAFIEEGKAMHQMKPGSEFHSLAQAGHLINLEKTEEFNSMLSAFLSKHAR